MKVSRYLSFFLFLFSLGVQMKERAIERRPMPMTSAECVAKGASSFLSHRYPACVTPDGPLLVGGGGGTRRRASVVPGIISASALTEKQRKGMEEVVQRTHRGTSASTSSPLLFRQILLSIMQRSSWKKRIPPRKQTRMQPFMPICPFFVEGSNYTQRNHRRQSCAIHGNRFVSLFRLPNQAFNQNDISV